jgi:hypothetical protein
MNSCEASSEGEMIVKNNRLLATCLMKVLFVLLFSHGVVFAEEVITEIRFIDQGFTCYPNQNAFRLIDLEGKEHRFNVKGHDKVEIVDSSEYKGPKQYATDYRGYTYRKVRIAGTYYHWFFVPASPTESLIKREISRMIPGD